MSDTPWIASAELAPAEKSRGGWPHPFRRGSLNVIISWIVPAALIGLWQISSSFGLVSDAVLPSPLKVAEAGWNIAKSGELFENIEVSFLRAMAGLVVGGGIGFLLGLSNGVSKISDTLTDSTLQMVRNIPHLALIPLVILWFGIGEEAKLFLVALGVFFPIYLNTLHGIKTIDPQLLEMGRSYGMTNMMLFRSIILPGALPSILVGLRFALGVMWLTLIVAETIAAQSGIGYMAMQAREFLQVDVVIFAILIYALLGKLADSVARLIEKRCLRWHPSFQGKVRS